MLIGKSKNTVDAKGRINVPAKFREDLGSSFIVTRGIDKCLYVYSKSEWAKLEASIGELPMASSRNIQRHFFANAEEVSTDTQGRIVVPQHLREYASIEKEAYVIGNCKRAEIWSAEKWLEQETEDTAEAVFNQMLELGF